MRLVHCPVPLMPLTASSQTGAKTRVQPSSRAHGFLPGFAQNIFGLLMNSPRSQASLRERHNAGSPLSRPCQLLPISEPKRQIATCMLVPRLGQACYNTSRAFASLSNRLHLKVHLAL